MSDTPRTDSSELPHALDDHHFVVGSFFARQLERELNAANYEVQHLREVYIQLQEGNERQRQRIKRLEEAGDKIVESGWSVQDWSGMCVVWAKAKEDKP